MTVAASRKSQAQRDAERVIRENPDAIDRLKHGDPAAILDVLEAAGATIGQATIRVRRKETSKKQIAAG